MISSLRHSLCGCFALCLLAACGSGTPFGGAPGESTAASAITCASQCGLSCQDGCYPTSSATDFSCGSPNGNARVQCAKVQGSPINTCESGCPSGYYASATLASQSCGIGFGGVQTQCRTVSGTQLQTCEEKCPAGYFPSAVHTNVQACALRYRGIQTTCTQVSGTGLDTCDDSCPAGYYPQSTTFDSAGCGTPYSNTRTHCALITGTSFNSCEACPTGYYPSRTQYPVASCGGRYGQIQTTCVQPTSSNLDTCGTVCPTGYTVQGSRTGVAECQYAYNGIQTKCSKDASSTCEENCPAGSYVTGTTFDPGCIGNLRVQCAKVQGTQFSTCQQDCPAGYTATSLQEFVAQCGGSFAGIQITCTRVSGNTLHTCESSCPDGYHVSAEQGLVPQCGNRYKGIETTCALNTGAASFSTCGPACPDGYYATRVAFPAFECAVRSHELKADCSMISGSSFTTCGPNCPAGWFPGDTRPNSACGPVYLNEETQCFKVNPQAPVITRQPQSVSIVAGQSTTLSVGATGQGPLSYQWYAGASGDRSNPVAHATSPLASVSPAVTTTYWVLVSNSHGETASNAATVTVTPACVAPSITAQPQSAQIVAGAFATLQVAATGTSLSFQWYEGPRGNTARPVAGATTAALLLSPPQTTSYWVRVSNECGHADSQGATVTVNAPCSAPAITAQPRSVSIDAGFVATLTVAASGTAPLTYQWYQGGSGDTASPLAGQTSASLLVTPAATSSYWVQVKNGCGSVDSDTAVVTVNPPPPSCGPDGSACGGDSDHTCQAGVCVCSNCASAVCCGASGNPWCDGQSFVDPNTGYPGTCASSLGSCSAPTAFDGSDARYHDGDILACVKFDGSYGWFARRPSPRCHEVAQTCDYLCSPNFESGQGFQCDEGGVWNQSPPLPGCFGGTLPDGWACP